MSNPNPPKVPMSYADLAIPCSSVMTEKMVEQVCQAIRAVLQAPPKP